MNEPETSTACTTSSTAPMVWRWPLYGYALLITLITVLFMPLALCRQIAAAGLEFWADSGAFCPALILVGIYSLYCVALLAKDQLTPLEIDRLQLAEFMAYASGLLGAIVRLVSLSHILRQWRCNVKETDVPYHAPSVRWSCDCPRSPPKDAPQVFYSKRLTNLSLDFQSVTDLVTQDMWRRPITSPLCPETQKASWRLRV
jgi:hypothetical protein